MTFRANLVLLLLATLPAVTALLPTAAAHDTDFDNALINGGFELGSDGFLGWTKPSYGCCIGVAVTGISATPAPCAGSQALRVQDQDYGAYVYQNVQSTPRTFGSGPGPAPSVVGALDFFANVYQTSGRVSFQSAEVLQNWPAAPL